MGKVYSHLSEEERQVIQIEVGKITPEFLRTFGFRP